MSGEASPWATWGILCFILGGTIVFLAGLGVHATVLTVLGAIMAVVGFIVQILLMVR